MGIIELIVVIILSYSGGYGHRYLTEPVKTCKTIKFDLPDKYLHKLEFPYCKEGIDPLTGIDEQCFVSEPYTWVFTEKGYSKVEDFSNGLQLKLFECNDLIKKYNKDKFIMEK